MGGRMLSFFAMECDVVYRAVFSTLPALAGKPRVALLANGAISESSYRGEEAGRLARLGRLLEGVGEFEKDWLAVGAAEEVDADGEAEDVAGGDGDVGVTGHGGQGRAATEAAVAVDQISSCGGAAGRGDEGVELVLVHGRVDALGARELAAF